MMKKIYKNVEINMCFFVNDVITTSDLAESDNLENIVNIEDFVSFSN